MEGTSGTSDTAGTSSDTASFSSISIEISKLKKINPWDRTNEEKARLKALQNQLIRARRSPEKVLEDKRRKNENQEKSRKNRSPEKVEEDRIAKNYNREKATKNRSPEQVEKDRIAKNFNQEKSRKNRSPEKCKEDKIKKNVNQQKARRAAQTKISNFVGRCANCLQNVPIIQELKDTKDNIGSMMHMCKLCKALKFKGETPITCCNGGKIKLEPFPTPPDQLQALWVEGSRDAKVFRKYSRSFANALSLSSIKVNERKFSGGFIPNVIFEGKVMQISGPLKAEEGEKPVFSQLYVHDPQLELSQRIDNMHLPTNLSGQEIKIIRKIMKSLQDLLKKVNPYIKDFIHICEIPEEDLAQGKLVISAEARPAGQHERRYNKQDCLTEVSILTNSHPHDLVLRKRGGGLTFVSDLNPSAQPLHFTLAFPFGTKGWDREATHAGGSTKRVTPREFFCYHIQVRNKESDYLFKMGRLFQEYLCYAQVTNENQKLNYIRMEQKALRSEKYKNIKAAVEEKDKMFPDDHNPKVGRKVLPSSFHGGPRWFHSKFQDGMAIVREFRKPDFFITMTSNPHWQEIQDALGPGECVQDRPDLVARVFKLKKDQLLSDLIKNDVLGKVAAFCWVIEWQKRGLPHMHLLVILVNNHRLVITRLNLD